MAISQGSEIRASDMRLIYENFRLFLANWISRGSSITNLSYEGSAEFDYPMTADAADINTIYNKINDMRGETYLATQLSFWPQGSVTRGNFIDDADMTNINTVVNNFDRVKCRNLATNNYSTNGQTCSQDCNRSCSHSTNNNSGCSYSSNNNSCSYSNNNNTGCSYSSNNNSCTYSSNNNSCTHGTNSNSCTHGNHSNSCSHGSHTNSCSHGSNTNSCSHGTNGNTCSHDKNNETVTANWGTYRYGVRNSCGQGNRNIITTHRGSCSLGAYYVNSFPCSYKRADSYQNNNNTFVSFPRCTLGDWHGNVTCTKYNTCSNTQHGQTCGQTCSQTCGNTCSQTCGNTCTQACGNTCSQACGRTCNPQTCGRTCNPQTCSRTCNPQTCSRTCNPQTCSRACGTEGTCSRTCNPQSCSHSTNNQTCSNTQVIDILCSHSPKTNSNGTTCIRS